MAITDELVAIARQVREAREQDTSVKHIRITPACPMGIVVELQFTPERARQCNAGPRQKEMLMHPEDWAKLLRNTENIHDIDTISDPAHFRVMGIPVVHE